jgi:hypothetical protein
MFARAVSFTEAKHIDEGIAFVKEVATPVLHQQRGYAGLITSVDRDNRLLGVLSVWQTEADRDASDSALLKVREEGQEVVGGTLTVEHFEQVLFELVSPPKVGNSLLVSRATTEPAKVDGALQYFKTEILPQIKQDPGLLFVRQLVDRQSGQLVVGTGWSDAASMKKGLEKALKRAATAPVTITDRSEREIVQVDAP